VQKHALWSSGRRAWERGDLAAIIADFTPDGMLISPGGCWQGYDALRRAAESFFAAAFDVQFRRMGDVVDALDARPV